MKPRRPTSAPAPASPPEDDPLRGVSPMHLDDEDERPTREDLEYDRTFFSWGPVRLPKFLTGKKRRS